MAALVKVLLNSLVVYLVKPQLVGGEPVGFTIYFTIVVKDLNSGISRTNPASGQGWTWTQGLQITSPAL